MTTTTRTLRRWRGLTFGGPTAQYHISKETGLDDSAIRSGLRDLPRADGAAPGLHFSSSRLIVLDLWWHATTAADAEALTEALREVTGPSEETIYRYEILRPDGSGWFLRGRVSRRGLPRDVKTETIGVVTAQLVFEFADPRIYSLENPGVIVPEFGSVGTGFDLPTVDLPWNMSPAEQLLGVAVNAGTARAYPLIRFDYPAGESGDADGVEVTNLTTGQSFEVVTAIQAGQTLIADMDALARATGDPIVELEGASRYSQWVSPRDPFILEPGSNLLRFDLDGTAPVVCRVDWRNTDL